MEGIIHRIVSAIPDAAISTGHKVDPTVGLDTVQPRQIADRAEEWNCGIPAHDRKLQLCNCPA
jgi:hypothetical protein